MPAPSNRVECSTDPLEAARRESSCAKRGKKGLALGRLLRRLLLLRPNEPARSSLDRRMRFDSFVTGRCPLRGNCRRRTPALCVHFARGRGLQSLPGDHTSSRLRSAARHRSGGFQAIRIQFLELHLWRRWPRCSDTQLRTLHGS